mmetsp:Transcript_78991/g.189687  ORF Transcript_78991/g.189687 Transcript_78991/m.189687 type:complete len:216 (+) Transcript_78991:2034-2681(+)
MIQPGSLLLRRWVSYLYIRFFIVLTCSLKALLAISLFVSSCTVTWNSSSIALTSFSVMKGGGGCEPSTRSLKMVMPMSTNGPTKGALAAIAATPRSKTVDKADLASSSPESPLMAPTTRLPIPPAAMSIASPALISCQTLVSLDFCSSSGESAGSAGPDRLWIAWSRLLGSLSRLQLGSAASSGAFAPRHATDARSPQKARCIGRIAQRRMACFN